MEENISTESVHTPEITATNEDAGTNGDTNPSGLVVQKKWSKQRLIALTIVVLGVLIAGGYYLYKTQFSDGGPVAIVNGLKIAREEFNSNVSMISQTASLQGADITDPAVQKEINDQALDILVSSTLLVAGAESAGISIEEDAIEAEYQKLLTQVGGAEQLTKLMTEAGFTEKKVRENLSEQLAIRAFLDKETGVDEINISDDEVQALYDSYKTGGVELPPFEEIQVQLSEQIRTQKQQEIVETFIASLREKATIEIKI